MNTPWLDTVPRKAAMLLMGLVAVSVLLLRPACDVYAAQAGNARASMAVAHAQYAPGHEQHDSDTNGDCCPSVSEHAVVTAIGWLPVLESETKLAPRSAAPQYPAVEVFALRSEPVSGPPPPTTSYYARSARILR